MELKRLKCPTCGASIDGNTIDLTKKTAKCPACDETFIIEQAENFALVEVDKTKDIANYRRNLAIATEKDDKESIKKYAEKILDILPEDYEAGYFYAYAIAKSGDSRYLYDFYSDFDRVYTEESCMRVAEHIVHHGELRDNVLIEKYLENLKYSADSYLSYYKQVFNDKLSKEELYDDITRDVFICHRSIDGKVAERIVKELENDGNKCWISSRNLRPNDNENYWDNIKKAIKSCRIFLVVSSRSAMMSTDVKKEMAYAKELNKRRLEVKIDDSEHTAFFKDFFDGCKWIKGDSREIKDRVSDLLLKEFNGDGKVVVRKTQKVKFNPIQKAGIVQNTVTGNLHEHNFEKAEIIEPTCKEQGYTVYRCACGEEKKGEFTPKRIEHEFQLAEIKEPTCTSDGYAKYECAYCEETKTEILYAKGHDFRLIETKEPTCIEEGHNIFKCSVCGEIKPVIVSKIDHTYGEWMITLNPTCEQSGEKKRQCSFCGHTETQSVNPEGHDYSEWQNLPDGITQERVCRKCGHYENRSTEEYQKEQEKKRKIELKKKNDRLYDIYIASSIFSHIAFLSAIIIAAAITFKHIVYRSAFIQIPLWIAVILCIVILITRFKYKDESGKIKNSYFWYFTSLHIFMVFALAPFFSVFIFCESMDKGYYKGTYYSCVNGIYIIEDCDGDSVYIPIEIHGCKIDRISQEWNCSKFSNIYLDGGIADFCSLKPWSSGFSRISPLSYTKAIYILNDEEYSRLSGDISIPYGVTKIGNVLFYHNNNLTSISIPNSVTSIESYAFSYCFKLTSVIIGNGVKSIGERAFYNCSSLTSITIGNSVTSIGEWAFSGCSSLTSIIFNGTKEQWNSIKKDYDWHYNVPATVVHCIDGDVT